ncbi:MAG: hypothetical protein PHU08_00230 [Dehalococcoidales bacterium]|nr:hypothetical protein [Dehalococcoidales bacterium]
MTTTYDITNSVGQVRLIISDTVIATAHFTDEEITYFLTANGNSVNLAAAQALEAWAASYAANADSEHIGDYAYAQTITKKMLDLAARLRETEATTPVLDWAEMTLVEEEEDE